SDGGAASGDCPAGPGAPTDDLPHRDPARREQPVADLIAQGPRPQDRWRRTFPTDRPVVLGCAGSAWPASWDDLISRRHAELSWDGRRLRVRRLPEARNPVFFKGQASDLFEIAPGEHFVVGSTTFTLANERANVSLAVPVPLEEQTFSTEY